MDSLRTRNEALEVQIREMKEKYKKELEDLQVNIHFCCPRVHTWTPQSAMNTYNPFHACRLKATTTVHSYSNFMALLT